MLTINTNLASLIAQGSLTNSTNLLNQAIERMTTGFKINGAKDNAANYSISTNMTTKIGAYQVAEDNAAMALDMVDTASESLSIISDGFSRLRALVIQARNGTYKSTSKTALQREASSLIDEIIRIYRSAEYNGVKLFESGTIDGNFINEVSQRDTEQMTELSSVSNSTVISSGMYSISTPQELALLAEMTNSGRIQGGEFVLADNIDLSEYSSGEGWTPIGNTTTNTFKGTFDGNGYVVYNLNIYRPNEGNVGLFGRSEGNIKNLGLENAKVVGKNGTGAIVGNAAKITIDNCYAQAVVISDDGFVGGLSGYLIGACTNSFFEGSVIGEEFVGGIAGEANSAAVQNCYTKGSISGNSIVGGIAGNVTYNAYIQNCWVQSDVAGRSESSVSIGGIAGHLGGTSIKGCYVLNVSDVSAVFVGGGWSTKVEDCFYNQAYSEEGVPLASDNITVTNAHVCSNKQPFRATYAAGGDKEICWTGGESNFEFQIGTTSELNSSVKIDMTFSLKGISELKDMDIESENYLKIIDNFINIISGKSTVLGGVQNRLFSVLEEISIQYDNLVSSRSTLRDADIAEVSSEYIRQQILQEASATLLAAANQSPAIALQLI